MKYQDLFSMKNETMFKKRKNKMSSAAVVIGTRVKLVAEFLTISISFSIRTYIITLYFLLFQGQEKSGELGVAKKPVKFWDPTTAPTTNMSYATMTDEEELHRLVRC